MSQEDSTNTARAIIHSASRYDAIIATFVGVCALLVSGYTAYMQRQQVRAAVWPILEFTSSNDPDIHFTLANKGVGPAIIRNVVVCVDGQPVANWAQVFDKLLGPGSHHFAESNMKGHVLSAGESMTIATPLDDNGHPLTLDKETPLGEQMNKARFRVSMEICYSSTLGQCWLLRSDADKLSSTTEISTCPRDSATSFQQ